MNFFIFIFIFFVFCFVIIKLIGRRIVYKQNMFFRFISFFFFILFIFLFRFFYFEPFYIPTGSMKPILFEGDFVFVEKYFYGFYIPFLKKKFISFKNPRLGDLIVFKYVDGKNYIKRVVGLPGDHVVYKNNFLYLNNRLVSFNFCIKNNVICKESLFFNINCMYFIYKDYFFDSNVQYYIDIIVPSNCYFVLGDNRCNSFDSRYWGFVRNCDLIGRAVYIWLSFDLQLYKFRFDRFFMKLS